LNNNDTENIIGFEALYESEDKCKCGVLWKQSAAHYHLNAVEETLKLEKQLKDGTYKAREPHKFTITHPKKRECLSIAFRDRVYQRSLNDNEIYPTMCKSFIYDNMACQKGKGTDLARNRLKEFLRKMYFKHGLKFYVAQFDIKGYYPNMPHDTAKDTFREKLRPCVYERAAEVLDGQYAGDTGFNPGSQMVQIVGISVPDKLDHIIKEKLHIKYYVRYMDDFVLFHEDKDYLKYCRNIIEQWLSERGFKLHERKTRIYPIKQSIKFLGFKFRVTDTGKVLMLIDKKKVQDEKRKLRRIVRKVKCDEMTKDKADEMYRAWKNHAAKGNSWKVVRHMDRFYKNLWTEATE